MTQFYKIICCILVILWLNSCSWWGDDEEHNPFAGVPEKELYADATQKLKKEQYASAIKRLEAMESMYPFSPHAEKAQEQLIYAYYSNGDYPAAAATSERFIELYPRSQKADYAYYIKGLANFQQPRGTFANIVPLDEAWRDAGTQAIAYSDFSVLIQRFPTSKYRADALQRLIYLRNTFAQRELNTARYYYDRKMYVAAIDRSTYIINNYPQAPAAKPALIIIYKANRALGLHKAAQDALIIYRHNYPHK